MLIESVWGFDREIEENTLDAFMRLLRNKVDCSGKAKLIHTVRGVGYMISANGLPSENVLLAAFTLWLLAIFALVQLALGAGTCQQRSTFRVELPSRLPLFRAPVRLDVAATDPRFRSVVI